MNTDLSVGKPSKVLWKFCLPLFGSVIFQQLYNITDSLVAGRLIGENALAAVGNSYEVTLIFIAIAFGLNIGCSVISSKYFGAKEHAKVLTSVSTTFLTTLFVSILLIIIGTIGAGTILKMIDTPDDIFNDSLKYLRIYIFGVAFLFFYNISTGVFSALGDSKTPFIFLACSSIANIIMDVWFVLDKSYFGLDLGIAGVAWATFICQGISSVLAVIFLIKRLKEFKNVKFTLFSFPIFKEIMRVAVPSMLQQGFVSVGNVIVQKVINGFGTGVVAGFSGAIKLNNVVVTSVMTFGNGVSNFTSQNIGAKKEGRIAEGAKSAVLMTCMILIPIIITYFIFGGNFIYLFVKDPSDIALTTAKQFLRIVSPCYFLLALKVVLDGVIRGSRHMNMFMFDTFVSLAIRVVGAIVLSVPFGSIGIWIAWPVGWAVGGIICLIFYHKITQQYKKAQLIE